MTEPNQAEEIYYPAEIPATTGRLDMTESFPLYYLREFTGGSAALYIYLSAVAKPDGWVFRKAQVMAEANVKQSAWSKAVAVLKRIGVYNQVSVSKKDEKTGRYRVTKSIAFRTLTFAKAEKLFWGMLKQLAGEPKERLKALGKIEFEREADWSKTNYSAALDAFTNGIMPSGYIDFYNRKFRNNFSEVSFSDISRENCDEAENAESPANAHEIAISALYNTPEEYKNNRLEYTRAHAGENCEHAEPTVIEEPLPTPPPVIDPPGLLPRIEDATQAQEHEQTEKFLRWFPGVHTFQTFDDSPDKNFKLAKVSHGLNRPNLNNLNHEGAGVFLTINETDGKGRTKDNIKKVRMVFGDFDGVDPTPAFADRPHLVVESSPGKFHCYWRVDDDFPLEGFKGVQKGIIHKYGSDKSVNDLPRVMRVPGFYHMKDAPFLTQIRGEFNGRPLSYAEAVEMFPPAPVKQWSAPEHQRNESNDGEFKGTYGTSAGNRNDELARCIGGMIKRGLNHSRIEEESFKFGAACSPPMTETEIRHCIKSITRYRS